MHGLPSKCLIDAFRQSRFRHLNDTKTPIVDSSHKYGIYRSYLFLEMLYVNAILINFYFPMQLLGAVMESVQIQIRQLAQSIQCFASIWSGSSPQSGIFCGILLKYLKQDPTDWSPRHNTHHIFPLRQSFLHQGYIQPLLFHLFLYGWPVSWTASHHWGLFYFLRVLFFQQPACAFDLPAAYCVLIFHHLSEKMIMSLCFRVPVAFTRLAFPFFNIFSSYNPRSITLSAVIIL